MSSEQPLGTRPGWWFRAIIKRKGSIICTYCADYAEFWLIEKATQV